ncbi:hypothetical protein GGX14DRAFT_391867 [Mycena pura]|uniref:Uncharacterized protein n=1 Tax=Mycena pura TaxID=153505 RepID=A0AAD6VNU5_9AGAR|nr:hypothetical protein GGX14DRAFT_391867 [Mycena pura]
MIGERIFLLRDPKHPLAMAGSLEILQKGLTALQKHVKKRKTAIEARLAKKERVDDDNAAWLDSDPIAIPTRREALHAAATLRNFVASVGDPYARKLEAILGTFGRQIQLEAMNAAVETSITDYFHRNE